ncbi:hypothetical protein ACJX0J_009796, partial [Zea mays]
QRLLIDLFRVFYYLPLEKLGQSYTGMTWTDAMEVSGHIVDLGINNLCISTLFTILIIHLLDKIAHLRYTTIHIYISGDQISSVTLPS